jgi:hypothetical protein
MLDHILSNNFVVHIMLLGNITVDTDLRVSKAVFNKVAHLIEAVHI